MFEIDKHKLGAFIAELRKEKGFTQKELSQRLFISDKAISKWETGASIPDTTLLIPLADLLGVTVTELLTYERIAPGTAIDAQKMDTIVKTTIVYTEEQQEKDIREKHLWQILYIIVLLIAGAEMLYVYLQGCMTLALPIFVPLCAFFGGYFCLFAKTKLPTYYDENRISVYTDGIFEMNISGLAFNNSNWSYILRVLRIWSAAVMILFPVLELIMMHLLSEVWSYIGWIICMILFFVGFFVPTYIVGKKYE